MQRILRKLKRIRLVYRRSSPLVKTVVLSAIALSAAALLTLALTIGAARNHTNVLAGQAAQLEQENQKLEDKIDKQGSLEGVKDYAEDELDLVDPDVVVIDPEETK
jgi:cell division protein FtsB